MGQPDRPVFPRRWDAAASPDFRPYTGAGGLIAVLPVGATEQHGPHLPLSVDRDLAEAFADAALARLDPAIPASALPVQAVGLSPEHANFPGTLTLDSATVQAQWCALGRSAWASGADKLLILNAHGGQTQIVELACNALRFELGMLTAGVTWPRLGLPAGLFDARERRYGIHAGAVETALMAYLWPQAVRPAAIDDFTPRSAAQAESGALLGYQAVARQAWRAEDLHPSGAAGDARQASASAGEAIFEHVVGQLTRILEELHASVPPYRAGREASAP